MPRKRRLRIHGAVVVAGVLLSFGLVALSLPLLFLILPPLLFPLAACLISVVLFMLCRIDGSKPRWLALLALMPVPFAVGMLALVISIFAKEQWH